MESRFLLSTASLDNPALAITQAYDVKEALVQQTADNPWTITVRTGSVDHSFSQTPAAGFLDHPELIGMQDDSSAWAAVDPGTDGLSMGRYSLSARDFVVHPGPNAAVVLSWQSPISGKVGVTLSISEMEDAWGDGVSYSFEKHSADGNTQLIRTGNADSGQGADITNGRMVLDLIKGDMLCLCILPQGSSQDPGNSRFDTTVIRAHVDVTGAPTADIVSALQLSQGHLESYTQTVGFGFDALGNQHTGKSQLSGQIPDVGNVGVRADVYRGEDIFIVAGGLRGDQSGLRNTYVNFLDGPKFLHSVDLDGGSTNAFLSVQLASGSSLNIPIKNGSLSVNQVVTGFSVQTGDGGYTLKKVYIDVPRFKFVADAPPVPPVPAPVTEDKTASQQVAAAPAVASADTAASAATSTSPDDLSSQTVAMPFTFDLSSYGDGMFDERIVVSQAHVGMLHVFGHEGTRINSGVLWGSTYGRTDTSVTFDGPKFVSAVTTVHNNNPDGPTDGTVVLMLNGVGTSFPINAGGRIQVNQLADSIQVHPSRTGDGLKNISLIVDVDKEAAAAMAAAAGVPQQVIDNYMQAVIADPTLSRFAPNWGQSGDTLRRAGSRDGEYLALGEFAPGTFGFQRDPTQWSVIRLRSRTSVPVLLTNLAYHVPGGDAPLPDGYAQLFDSQAILPPGAPSQIVAYYRDGWWRDPQVIDMDFQHQQFSSYEQALAFVQGAQGFHFDVAIPRPSTAQANSLMTIRNLGDASGWLTVRVIHDGGVFEQRIQMAGFGEVTVDTGFRPGSNGPIRVEIVRPDDSMDTFDSYARPYVASADRQLTPDEEARLWDNVSAAIAGGHVSPGDRGDFLSTQPSLLAMAGASDLSRKTEPGATLDTAWTAQERVSPTTPTLQWFMSIDRRHIYGLSFNPALIDFANGNPTGAYYHTLVREGWILLRTYANTSTGHIDSYWQYGWDSAGQLIPAFEVDTYFGAGDPVSSDLGQ